MFNARMISDRLGSGVAFPRRIEGQAIAVARPRRGQVEVFGAVTMQRFGAPTA